jgi:uncharacterized protein
MIMQYEDKNDLSEKELDMRRAIDSLNEEMGAVNAYIQRAKASSNESLKKILLHHSKEEKEHAAMLIEWIRRQDPEFSKELKDYVFTEKEISH